MTKLVRKADGSLGFDWASPDAVNAGPTGKGDKAAAPAPAQQSPRLVLDDSVTKGHPASAALWGPIFAQLNDEPLVAPVPAQKGSNPAETFYLRAKDEPWFVSAEMKRPLGGRKSGSREPRLEVTVRDGGKDTAERVLTELGLSGHVTEQRPIPNGRGYGDHKRR